MTKVSPPIHSSLLPEDWPEALKQDYINKTTDVSSIASESESTSSLIEAESKRNDSQDQSIRAANNNASKALSSASAATERANMNAQAISTHVGSLSAHGVNGNNVGTADYAQSSIGGVVLLAESIAELSQYTAPIAPAAYDQTEEQAFRQGVQSQINGIINKVNEIIAGQKSAKQMGL
tara:strand:- start:3521 stop:4057 length:537 start_codon:yes stop_codon:yes gene_type:complete